MTPSDWDNILNNICMVSFMQGMPCGLTTFNNYVVVASNDNNTSVDIDNLYFTENIGTTSQGSNYHKYDCPELGNIQNYNGSDTYQSDLSAEFKYDAKKINTKLDIEDNSKIAAYYDDATNTYYKVGDNGEIGEEITNQDDINKLISAPTGSEVKYLYDHQNLGCYTCITSGNYTPVVKMYNGQLCKTIQTTNLKLLIKTQNGYINEDGTAYNPQEDGELIQESEIKDAELEKRRKTIYTSIAKHRNSLYKTNDYVNR